MIKVTGIQTIEDIFHILEHQPDFEDWHIYGDVNTKREGDYILFNYAAEAQYAGRWNNFELMSRGLIIDAKNLCVMARPFDKFFNWGEGGRVTESPIEYVTEKMDGSLGVCWYDPTRQNIAGSKWRITTRGSFDSAQAGWATAFLNTRYGNWLQLLKPEFTYLFEIIYPENRIVVDYGNQLSDLFLLAVRENETGRYWDIGSVKNIADYLGCQSAKLRNDISRNQDAILVLFKAISKIKGVEKEGYVTVHRDGSRWKFKGEDYLRIHRVISTFSFKHTLEAVSTGTFNEWIETIPDEFLTDIRRWKHNIEIEFQNTKEQIERAFIRLIDELVQRNIYLKDDNHRKEFAILAQQHYPQFMPYLFRRLDKKLTDDFIYQRHDFSHCEDE